MKICLFSNTNPQKNFRNTRNNIKEDMIYKSSFEYHKLSHPHTPKNIQNIIISTTQISANLSEIKQEIKMKQKSTKTFTQIVPQY